MKREKSRLRAILSTALLATTVFVTNNTVSAANPPPTSMQLLLLALADNAMALTHRLLNDSSAAKGVLASDNADVKALYSEAMKFYGQAEKADASGDQETRDQALLQAKMALLKAAQQVKVAPELTDRSHSLFQRRTQSADALLDAHKRIREELKAGPEVEALENKATTDIAAANASFQKDDVDGATRLIDQALSALKGSLISMRNGTTLVRSLHFDTPKDEYEYELDRNRSHTLLSSILLQREPLAENARQRFDKDMSQARALRQQAEAQAAKEEYEAAIKTLEESTRHLVAGLGQAAQQAGIKIQTTSIGSMFGLFFSDEPVVDFTSAKSCDLAMFTAYYKGMRDKGIYLAPSQFEAGFVSTAHDEAAIEQTLSAARDVFAQVAA